MSFASHHQSVSVTDYLRGEELATRKHEYVEGAVYAMVGATNVHNRIATNVTVTLGMQLRGKRCQVFNSDTKVRVRSARGTRFYYPDVLVVCRANPPSDTFHDAPVVLVEVLFESTRRIDEHEKREAYLSIDALSVYVLLEPAAATALVYRREENGFRRETYEGLDANILVPEIQCDLRLSDIYDQVEFPATEEEDFGET